MNIKASTANETSLSLKGKLIEKNTHIWSTIESFSHIQELDLSDNELVYLPSELSKFKSLKILNIRNNPFKDYKEIALMLQSLPKLTELFIDLYNQSDAELLLSQLPQLRLLNGKSVQLEPEIEFDLDDERLESISLNSEVNRFNSIIQRTAFFQGFSSFKTDLQFKLKEQVEYINSNMDIPHYLYAINILKAKIDVYSYIQSKLVSMIPYMTKKNELNEIAKIIQEIIGYISENESEIIAIVFQIQPKILNQLSELKLHYEGVIQGQGEERERDREVKGISSEQKRHNNNHNNKEANIVLNDHFNFNGSQSKTLMKTSLSTHNMLKGSAKKANTSKGKDSKYTIQALLKSKPQTNTNTKRLTKSPSSTLRTIKSSFSSILSHQLSLKQLLTLISEIYQSKRQYDQKCKDNRLPKETLEQHMYTFLNKKYGLKNITLEMASSIINGIRQYSQINSEVCLFGKILRNELEEESNQVFIKLKQTLIELLNYYYQIKYPYKGQGVIEKMIQEKQLAFLTMEEWVNIIKYLFPVDNDIIKEKILEYIAKQNESNEKYIEINYPKVESDSKQLSREEIKTVNNKKIENNLNYYDFTMLLLDFQIRLRDKYLCNFIKVFRSVDEKNDGVVNENEFKSLLMKFDIFNNDIVNGDETFEHLLTLVDPFNTKRISFSDCVYVFSNEKYDEEMSIMDKIALNTNTIDNSSSNINND